LIERLRGFEDALRKLAPRSFIHILYHGGNVPLEEFGPEFDAEFRQNSARVLRDHPEIRGLFSTFSGRGVGLAELVQELGLQEKIQILIFDFDATVVKLVETGRIRAVIAQDFYMMGYVSLILLHAARSAPKMPAKSDGSWRAAALVDFLNTHPTINKNTEAKLRAIISQLYGSQPGTSPSIDTSARILGKGELLDMLVADFKEMEDSISDKTEALVREIEVRKQAERDLRKLNEELEQRVRERTSALVREKYIVDTFMENVPDAIYFKDRDSRITRTNRAHTEKLGLSSSARVIGKTDFDFFPEELARSKYKQEQEITRTGQPILSMEEPDVQGSWSLTTKMPLRDENGIIIGTFGISRDISAIKQTQAALEKAYLEVENQVQKRTAELQKEIAERKRVEEKLLQVQKMEAIGQLAGGVAHDFNNLLTVIGGYCELIQKELPEGNFVKAQIDEIAKAAEQATALIKKLLTFSRKQIQMPQVINPNELVSAVENMLIRIVGEDIELKTYCESETGNIKADRRQMEQVLMNLVVNARDAMPEGGKLTIETSNQVLDGEYALEHPGVMPGEYVRISVSDTGQGMDKEVLSHIFEPFFTTKAPGRGTGLGLSTVYGIIKQSSGYITCYSEPGKGTTFMIYLPRTAEVLDRTVALSEEVARSRGRETILLVEDDERVRSFTRALLEKNGYTVIAASGGQEALAAQELQRCQIALVITDVVMPQMSGKELAQKLSMVCPGVKVLFVSGYTGNVIVHHGVLDSGIDFLQKPFKSKEFLAKIREMLDRS
jgi:PAS domain S-box-containing protein